MAGFLESVLLVPFPAPCLDSSRAYPVKCWLHKSIYTPESLAKNKCVVIAPYFERITSPFPSAEQLLERRKLLSASLEYLTDFNLPIIGIGHSIGANLLVSLSGGQLYLRSGECFPLILNKHIKKLVLMAPPTGYFQVPKALDAIHLPIQIWGGALDLITPPQQIEVLKKGLAKDISVDIHLIDGAGHFSFMNTLPPTITDPMINREEFLVDLAAKILEFVKI